MTRASSTKGSVNATFEFKGVGTHVPEYYATAPTVNGGGRMTALHNLKSLTLTGWIYAASSVTGPWYFFALSLDLTVGSNHLRFYLGDGDTVIEVHTASRTVPADGTLGAPNVPLYFGNSQARDRAWSGYLDNLRIYGSATDGTAAIKDIPTLSSIMKFDDAIPEPGTVSVVLLGAALLGIRRRWHA